MVFGGRNEEKDQPKKVRGQDDAEVLGAASLWLGLLVYHLHVFT